MKNYLKSFYRLALFVSVFAGSLQAMNNQEPEDREQPAAQEIEIIVDEKTAQEYELLRAAHRGDLKSVQNYLAHGVNIDCKAPEQGGYCTPLLIASEQGHLPIVQYLLDHHATIDMQAANDFTSLIIAADRGHIDIVRLLISRGAEINFQAKNWHNATALMRAVQNGKSSVVNLLVQFGADPMLQDDEGHTVLAAANGCPIQRMIDFLSIIPFSHSTSLKNCFYGIVAFDRFCQNASPELPQEMRCTIISTILKLFIDDRMINIRKLFAIPNNNNQNARDVVLIDRDKALAAHQEVTESLENIDDQEERENRMGYLRQCENYVENCNQMAQLFDLNNQESTHILAVRKQLCTNIKKIMFSRGND